jgi:hypothetical protein
MLAGGLVCAVHVLAGFASLIVLHDPGLARSFMLSAVLTAGVTALLGHALRRPPGRGDGGSGGSPDEPEPPWWPGFEADLRRYTREAGPRRAPVGA